MRRAAAPRPAISPTNGAGDFCVAWVVGLVLGLGAAALVLARIRI